MPATATEPIRDHWTTEVPTPVDRPAATAADVTQHLARVEPTDIDADLTPLLAAAATEVALQTGIRWRHSDDDPPVALVRLIARVNARNPTAGGPHTAHLMAHLRRTSG